MRDDLQNNCYNTIILVQAFRLAKARDKIKSIQREPSKLKPKKVLTCRTKIIVLLKGVFAKNERGYRLNAIKKRF